MTKRILVSTLAFCLSAPLAAAPASQEAARQSFVFYDAVIVTAVQQPNGNITAFVRVGEGSVDDSGVAERLSQPIQ